MYAASLDYAHAVRFVDDGTLESAYSSKRRGGNCKRTTFKPMHARLFMHLRGLRKIANCNRVEAIIVEDSSVDSTDRLLMRKFLTTFKDPCQHSVRDFGHLPGIANCNFHGGTWQRRFASSIRKAVAAKVRPAFILRERSPNSA